MSPASLSIVPIFATPFVVMELPEAQALNPAVAEIFARHAPAGPLCYQSAPDLLERAEGPVRQVCDEILRGVSSAVAAVNTFSSEQLKSLSMQARGWFTIVPPDGCLQATSHPLTSWCAIYCVQAPQASPQRGDSGLLRLYEWRLATMFADATNAAMQIPFTPGHYSWRPVPGHVAIFPGSLTYEVPLIRSTGSLILITVRTRFVGPGQEGLSRW